MTEGWWPFVGDGCGRVRSCGAARHLGCGRDSSCGACCNAVAATRRERLAEPATEDKSRFGWPIVKKDRT